MIKHLYILLIGFLLTSLVFSQKDTIYELGGNNVIGTYYNVNKDLPNSVYNRTHVESKKSALTLPFLDDFSQNYIYPDANLWEDINVYVNSNFPDSPITYGVATFDGLDSTGTPYNFASPTSFGPADTLTSKQIDLTTIIDSVFLSFYYQPQGNGNKPETRDSLRLEFFRQSDSSWVRMWGMPGMPNQPFEKVMIALDTTFHNNVFQFRFINWATLSGNVDHWHIDYVYLNDNRTHQDTTLNDISFITNHHNLLNDFTAMPWNHYLTDTSGFMKFALDITHINNFNTPKPIQFHIETINNNGAGPIEDSFPLGISSYTVPANSQGTIPIEIDQSPHNFYFPVEIAESKVFQVKNYFDFSGLPDDYAKNDTVLSYQVFHDYYAYDDGSAELGYGVQGIGSKLAHEFNLKKEDTLTALQIYFNPIMNNLSAQTFRLKVWSSLIPEVEIYSQPATQFTSPIYSNTNEYLKYTLNAPLYLTAGTYYFGWEKITSEFLNVGWDVNTNNRLKVHFNSVGVWENPTSNIPDGSLMLRPVFRNLAPVVVSSEDIENNTENFEVYPNPTKESIYFKINNSNQNSYQIELLDIYGKLLLQTESNLSNKFNVTGVSNGLYIVRFTNTDNRKSILKKIIISK
jgi:hypothetical protein